MKTENLIVGRYPVTTIQVGELTSANIYCINEFLANKTKEALAINNKGEVINFKPSPYELVVKEHEITLYLVLLASKELRSVGIRLTPVE